jgi:hypothetical protein
MSLGLRAYGLAPLGHSNKEPTRVDGPSSLSSHARAWFYFFFIHPYFFERKINHAISHPRRQITCHL